MLKSLTKSMSHRACHVVVTVAPTQTMLSGMGVRLFSAATTGTGGPKRGKKAGKGKTTVTVDAKVSESKEVPEVKATKGSDGIAPAATTAAGTKETEHVLGGYKDMVHPKLKLFGAKSTYANALFSAASKKNQLGDVEKDLKQVYDLLVSEPKFMTFLKNPTIQRHKKKEGMLNVAKQANFCRPVAGLFAILADNGQLGLTKEVIEAFQKIMSAEKGEVSACVVSANALSSTQLKQVEEALKLHIEKDETLILDSQVDPTILGGLKVHVGSKFIDLSLSTKMDKIQAKLSEPVL